MKTMFLDYQSLTAVIHVNTFGLLQVVVVKDFIIHGIALVPLVGGMLLLLMLVVTGTVSQAQHIKVIMIHIISMTHCGMEQDV